MVDNTLTLDRVVLVANIITRYDINISIYIIVEIHERAFKYSNSILFPCLIDRLCRDSSVQTMHAIDNSIEVGRTKDVGMIKDDTNPVFQR